MAIREILTDQDPALHKKCHSITRFDDKLSDLIDDMRETLISANGAGLAAPQVGILRRVVVLYGKDEELLELVNPELIFQEGEQDGLEGCLSVPGLWGYVKRPETVRVKAQDRKGNWSETGGEGIVARWFCHEIEHLEGHVFTEHVDHIYTSEEVERIMEEEERKGKRS